MLTRVTYYESAVHGDGLPLTNSTRAVAGNGFVSKHRIGTISPGHQLRGLDVVLFWKMPGLPTGL